jgi:predicted RNA-binding protein YlqC (UPF0109 family)
MKELVEFLAKNIVSDPKSVKLAESTQDSQQIIRLSVAGGDMGKIIGKSGRIIKSIRTLLKIKAIKEGKRVYLELAEEEQ